VKKSKQLIPQSGTKARRSAKAKSFLFFATFAYFAPWRGTGLFIHGLIHRLWGITDWRIFDLQFAFYSPIILGTVTRLAEQAGDIDF
jgi:hypothetical protein